MRYFSPTGPVFPGDLLPYLLRFGFYTGLSAVDPLPERSRSVTPREGGNVMTFQSRTPRFRLPGAAPVALVSLLLSLALSPAAHAVKNLSVEGHLAPVTLVVGEPATIRWEV